MWHCAGQKHCADLNCQTYWPSPRSRPLLICACPGSQSSCVWRLTGGMVWAGMCFYTCAGAPPPWHLSILRAGLRQHVGGKKGCASAQSSCMAPFQSSRVMMQHALPLCLGAVQAAGPGAGKRPQGTCVSFLHLVIAVLRKLQATCI